MELSAVATEGLTLCGDTARVGDRSFRCLVMSACDILLKRKDEDVLHDNDELSSVDAAVLKQSYAGIVTLALEAAKTNSDTPQIRCLWNNHMEKVNQPTYLITLKTEETNKSKGKDIQFSCSMEQLQDLVGKLRDACKTMERVANT
ncbi:predicted protein [Nematostella vectensis]|uniref:COMM domain-containing protein 3 n=1 Tax=Nematostella vectensis TaxID=45351 RepID=A7RHW4_NEMVE|nr:predicted protein [Nematostella vectensis]|eukprot:XP_001641111.1 predicted protein [Nematostella vectensis]